MKKGDIGYQLTRPVSYLLFHYFSYMGEALVRLVVNLLIGGALGLQLDAYLAQPKPVLLHVLISRMSVTAFGDLTFGLLLYVMYGDVSLLGIVKFAVALLLAMLIFTFFHVITQSLAFYIGNADGIGQQFFITFITFATYPTDIFKGFGRLVLFSVIPVGFISYMPIGLLKSLQPSYVWGLLAATAILVAGGIWFFSQGLKRYGSGNMLTIRM